MRSAVVAVVISTVLVAACASGRFGPKATAKIPEGPRTLKKLTTDERRRLLQRAHVWQPINTASLNMLVDSLPLEDIVTTPRPCLTLRTPRQKFGAAADRLMAELEFDYGGALIPAGRTTLLAVSTELGLVIRRNPKIEAQADSSARSSLVRSRRLSCIRTISSSFSATSTRRRPFTCSWFRSATSRR